MLKYLAICSCMCTYMLFKLFIVAVVIINISDRQLSNYSLYKLISMELAQSEYTHIETCDCPSENQPGLHF